jgi:uncharacterized protein (DUF433 family)
MTLTISLEPAPIKTDDRGVVRVAETRVTLDTIVTAFLEGCTPEEIKEQYPSLQLSDIRMKFIHILQNVNISQQRFKGKQNSVLIQLKYAIVYSPDKIDYIKVKFNRAIDVLKINENKFKLKNNENNH